LLKEIMMQKDIWKEYEKFENGWYNDQPEEGEEAPTADGRRLRRSSVYNESRKL
jgi:hypothetical protein